MREAAFVNMIKENLSGGGVEVGGGVGMAFEWRPGWPGSLGSRAFPTEGRGGQAG